MRAGLPIGLTIAVLFSGLVAGCHQSDPAAPPYPDPPVWRSDRAPLAPVAWQERGEFISEDLCEICHPETVVDFEAVPHSRLIEGIEGTGCESCHGPGEAHEADDDAGFIDDFPAMGAAEVASRCARCHFEDLRLLDSQGKHTAAATISCVECHRIHPPGEPIEGEQEERHREEIQKEVRECRVCHENAMKVHLRSNHGRLVAGESAIGCQGCHGDGEAHARAGGLAPIDRPSRERAQILCVECHSQRPAHARWLASAHQKEGLGCLDCHNLLQPMGTTTMEQKEMDLCARCHNDIASKFREQHHHPVPEGTMRCTSCHDPHRDRKSVLSNRNMERRCAECHGTQTGPFVYEHEAGKVDGCQACHDPHGSSHPRMLKSWPVRNLCLSCHPDTPLNHNQASFSPFRECVSCHTEVHGSDIDRRLWR